MSSMNLVLSFQSHPSYYPPPQLVETTHKLFWDLLPNGSSAILPGLARAANDRGGSPCRTRGRIPSAASLSPGKHSPVRILEFQPHRGIGSVREEQDLQTRNSELS